MDAEGVDVDRCYVQVVEHCPQRADATVAGYLQGERFVVAGGAAEDAGGRGELGWIGELQPDVAARDQPLELVGGALRDEPAVVEEGDPVSQPVGLLEVLGGEEDRHAGGDQAANDLPHGAARARIEASGGLVQENDTRVADKRHRQIQLALHPAGVGARRLSGSVDQVEPVQQVGSLAATLGPVQVIEVGHEQEVLLAGEQVVHGGELARDADDLAHRVGLANDVMAEDPHGPAVGLDQRGEDLDGCGLAGAIRTEQREDRAFRDVQVDAVEDPEVTIGLAQPDDIDRRSSVGCHAHTMNKRADGSLSAR